MSETYDFSQLPRVPPRGVTHRRAWDQWTPNDKKQLPFRWKKYQSEHDPSEPPAYLPAVTARNKADQ